MKDIFAILSLNRIYIFDCTLKLVLSYYNNKNDMRDMVEKIIKTVSNKK